MYLNEIWKKSKQYKGLVSSAKTMFDYSYPDILDTKYAMYVVYAWEEYALKM